MAPTVYLSIVFFYFWQNFETSLASLQQMYESFKITSERMLKEAETDLDAVPLNRQTCAVENSWKVLNQKCNKRRQKSAVIEEPSHDFYNMERNFSAWLDEAETRLQSFEKIPSNLQEADESAKLVEVWNSYNYFATLILKTEYS